MHEVDTYLVFVQVLWKEGHKICRLPAQPQRPEA